MQWIFNDGGRQEAGFKGLTGDCVVRAIAIATETPYQFVYDEINELAKLERPSKRKHRSNSRLGVHKVTYRRYLKEAGWEWTPTKFIGQKNPVHLRASELPGGRLIVSLSRHLSAVIDHVVHDTHDPSRSGTRTVYGYWSRD